MKTAAPRSVIQFHNEPLKGLIAQVLAVEGDKLKCLCRNVEGQAQFFDAPAADGYSVIGIATLGPKSLQPRPEPPPPLNPHELLEPLPPDVQPVPMNDDQIPNATPLPDGYKPELPKAQPKRIRKKLQAGLRTTRPTKFTLEPLNQKPKKMHTARVRNALGNEVVVTVGIPEGAKLYKYHGVAIFKATDVIPPAKPYTVSDWKAVEEPAVAPPIESATITPQPAP